MKNIIIVECMSTGINFIKDIINNNCNPIILETKMEDGEGTDLYKKLRADSYKEIKEDFELIHEKNDYSETLDMVREYNPSIVIPGSEKGVRLATRLANDLKLKCNPIENLDAITLKDKMQDKIAEKGLRHIRGKAIHTIEEAIQYYDEEGFEEVVVKPTYSAGSVGVKICLNKQEMIDSLNELFEEVNVYGNKLTEFVIQERIDGEEYVVNTVSCNGKHRVTLLWKYHKVKTPEGGQIYDYMESINELGLGEADLIDYAYDVADALDIRYGPIHGEYMIDENGPVLIEVNCRPCGFNLDSEYLDMISGQHETDSVLDAYLNPEKFEYEYNKGYNLYAHGALKFFIVPKDIVARSSPMKYISSHLESHYKTSSDIMIDEAKYFVKTQDLETAGGTVYLTHPDGEVIGRDIEFLRSVERNAFQLILSDDSNRNADIDENESYEDVKLLIKEINAYGPTLIITDQKFDDLRAMQVSPDELDEMNVEFDCVVVNLNKSLTTKTDEDIAYSFLNISNKVKKGGLIFIPKSTYKYMPNGRISIEALIKVLNFKIELPMHNANKLVIGLKK